MRRAPTRTVVVLDGEPPTDLVLDVAAGLTTGPDAELILVAPKLRESGSTTYPAADAKLARHRKAARDRLGDAVVVEGSVIGGDSVGDVATEAASLFHAGLVIIQGAVDEATVEHIRDATACEVVRCGSDAEPSDAERVLGAVAGGPHSGLVVDAASALARHQGVGVGFVTVVPSDAEADAVDAAEALLADAVARFDGERAPETTVVRADDVAGTIQRLVGDSGILVIGGPQSGRIRRLLFGSVPERLVQSSGADVLTAWTAPDRPAPLQGGER